MSLLQFQHKRFECAEGETVLECLTRQGEAIPSSCRNGACQTCLMRATKGRPPTTAQNGLKSTLREQGYFLACVCRPQETMEIALPGAEIVSCTPATVLGKEALNTDILRLSLRCHHPFDYHAGQFVHLKRGDGLSRSYSLATLPSGDGLLELHVRRLADGALSRWIHDTLQVGDVVEVTGPFGNCFYTAGCSRQGLLLIGTGSGLAPLRGIVTDALQQKHTGPIRLYHGSWKPEGLYLTEELHQLRATHPNFVYVPCVDSEPLPGYREGRADQIALADLSDLRGWRVYLCGHPEMVKSGKKRAYLVGASLQDIYADPFILSASPVPRQV